MLLLIAIYRYINNNAADHPFSTIARDGHTNMMIVMPPSQSSVYHSYAEQCAQRDLQMLSKEILAAKRVIKAGLAAPVHCIPCRQSRL